MNNKKIINYKTINVCGKPIDEDVNDAIKTGWQPLGGVDYFWDEANLEFCYCQAVVKYES